MDIQKLMDAMSEQCRMTRSGYHLTLGDAIKALEACRPDKPVTFDIGNSPGPVQSYRGYYSDLAFTFAAKAKVAEVLTDLRKALGATFEGYKGGDFVMKPNTPMWASSYGDASGIAVMALDDREDGVVLITRPVDQ